jgi:hypothetical protein
VIRPLARPYRKNGGFEAFGFANQGQCVASVNANERAGN